MQVKIIPPVTPKRSFVLTLSEREMQILARILGNMSFNEADKFYKMSRREPAPPLDHLEYYNFCKELLNSAYSD